MEKPASSTMMRKIDSTTDRVVSLPTLAALLSTWKPSKQPTSPMTMAKTGALMMPTRNVFSVTASCQVAHVDG